MLKKFLPFVSNDTEIQIVQSDIQIEKISISPAFAAELLKGNVANRSLIKRKIAQYVSDMKNGLWTPDTAETVKLTKNMRVLDGQHRLHAIVIAGVTIDMFVAYNVPETAMNNIDTGTARSVKNIVELNGIPNAQHISSMLKKYIAYVMFPNLPDHDPVKKGGADANMVLKLYNEKPDTWQEIVSKISKSKKIFKIELSYLMAWYGLCLDIDEADTTLFFDMLIAGLFTNEKDPIRLLREYLISNKVGNDSRATQYAIFVKAWNLFRSKKTVSILRYQSNEIYPKLK